MIDPVVDNIEEKLSQKIYQVKHDSRTLNRIETDQEELDSRVEIGKINQERSEANRNLLNPLMSQLLTSTRMMFVA
jgi:hypothetical protein